MASQITSAAFANSTQTSNTATNHTYSYNSLHTGVRALRCCTLAAKTEGLTSTQNDSHWPNFCLDAGPDTVHCAPDVTAADNTMYQATCRSTGAQRRLSESTQSNLQIWPVANLLIFDLHHTDNTAAETERGAPEPRNSRLQAFSGFTSLARHAAQQRYAPGHVTTRANCCVMLASAQHEARYGGLAESNLLLPLLP